MVKNELSAYLAGIIDGEGCISIRKTFQYNKYIYYKPMIEVGMTVKAPIQLLANTFGGSVWYEVKKGRFKTQHKWRITGTNVIPVINAISPYLTVKKDQAILCLKLCSHIAPRTGKSNKWSDSQRIEQTTIRKVLFDKMFALNHI